MVKLEEGYFVSSFERRRPLVAVAPRGDVVVVMSNEVRHLLKSESRSWGSLVRVISNPLDLKRKPLKTTFRVDSGNLRKHSLLVIIVMTSKYIFMHIN